MRKAVILSALCLLTLAAAAGACGWGYAPQSAPVYVPQSAPPVCLPPQQVPQSAPPPVYTPPVCETPAQSYAAPALAPAYAPQSYAYAAPAYVPSYAPQAFAAPAYYAPRAFAPQAFYGQSYGRSYGVGAAFAPVVVRQRVVSGYGYGVGAAFAPVGFSFAPVRTRAFAVGVPARVVVRVRAGGVGHAPVLGGRSRGVIRRR